VLDLESWIDASPDAEAAAAFADADAQPGEEF
jgi:hypothetical protein